MPNNSENLDIKKPIFVSMLEFLRTGNFGPIKLGMPHSQLFLLLGFPSKYSNASLSFSWVYGNIEFHFHESGFLWLIHSDYFRPVPNAGTNVEIDNWILCFGTPLTNVERELTKQGIKFHQTEQLEYIRSAYYLTVGAEIGLIFNKEPDENEQSDGLEAISYSLMNEAVRNELSVAKLNNLLFEIAEVPIDLLAEKYLSDAGSDEAYRQLRLISDLVFVDNESQETIADEILFRLHDKLKNSEVEQVLWQAVISAIGKPLPEKITDDLFDRNIAFNAFEHTPQLQNIDWKVAEKSQAKRLRLAKEFYLEAKYNITIFERFLRQFPDNQELLESLIELEPTSSEKEQILLAIINKLPNADYCHHLRQIRLWVNEARYQELSTARARDLLDTEEPVVVEAVGENESLLAQANKDEISLDEIRALIALGQPKILRALATNKKTPPEILVELSKTKNIPLASEIRRLAQETRHSQKTHKD